MGGWTATDMSVMSVRGRDGTCWRTDLDIALDVPDQGEVPVLVADVSVDGDAAEGVARDEVRVAEDGGGGCSCWWF